MQIEVVPFEQEQAELARDVYRRYGKGRHAAALNHGECFAYALCAVRGEPLLFKGDDFCRPMSGARSIGRSAGLGTLGPGHVGGIAARGPGWGAPWMVRPPWQDALAMRLLHTSD